MMLFGFYWSQYGIDIITSPGTCFCISECAHIRNSCLLWRPGASRRHAARRAPALGIGGSAFPLADVRTRTRYEYKHVSRTPQLEDALNADQLPTRGSTSCRSRSLSTPGVVACAFDRDASLAHPASGLSRGSRWTPSALAPHRAAVQAPRGDPSHNLE